MAATSKNNGKPVNVYVEQVKGSKMLWATVAVEYDIHNPEAVKRYPNVLRTFARLGFTAEANYKPNNKGIAKIVLSKLGGNRELYSTWLPTEARQNLAALERAFRMLDYPWQVRPVTADVVRQNEEADSD